MKIALILPLFSASPILGLLENHLRGIAHIDWTNPPNNDRWDIEPSCRDTFMGIWLNPYCKWMGFRSKQVMTADSESQIQIFDERTATYLIHDPGYTELELINDNDYTLRVFSTQMTINPQLPKEPPTELQQPMELQQASDGVSFKEAQYIGAELQRNPEGDNLLISAKRPEIYEMEKTVRATSRTLECPAKHRCSIFTSTWHARVSGQCEPQEPAIVCSSLAKKSVLNICYNWRPYCEREQQYVDKNCKEPKPRVFCNFTAPIFSNGTLLAERVFVMTPIDPNMNATKYEYIDRTAEGLLM